jgi:hypothetical protein
MLSPRSTDIDHKINSGGKANRLNAKTVDPGITLLRDISFSFRDVLPEGNCFFSCLIHSLRIKKIPDRLRTTLLESILEKKASLQDLLEEDFKEFHDLFTNSLKELASKMPVSIFTTLLCGIVMDIRIHILCRISGGTTSTTLFTNKRWPTGLAVAVQSGADSRTLCPRPLCHTVSRESAHDI